MKIFQILTDNCKNGFQIDIKKMKRRQKFQFCFLDPP